MKFIITLMLVLFPIAADACNAALKTCINQRNAANNNTNSIPVNNLGVDGIYYFEHATLTPKQASLGGGCSITSGVLSCSGSSSQADWNATSGPSQILNKPALATVATSGNYPDLMNLPSIPAAQVNSDWLSSSGVSQIINKPVSFPPSAHSHVISDITGLLTELNDRVLTSDSRLTDARTPLSHTQTASTITDFNSAADARVSAGITGKENTITTGTTGQYWRGDKSWQTLDRASVGLSNVDNTSDSGKPISTLTQAALNAKFNNPSGSASQCVRGDGSIGSCPVTLNATGSPSSRTVSLATAYQCTDTSRPCMITATMTCPLTLSLLAGATCAGEFRIGSANTVATGGGTNIAPIQRNASGILGLSTNDYETKTVKVPVGWYFAIRQTTGSGMNIISVFDQAD